MLKLFVQQLTETDQRQHVEHSFEMQQIVEHLAQRLEADGGFALVMDYGHSGEGSDTFRVCTYKYNWGLCLVTNIMFSASGIQGPQVARSARRSRFG